MIEAAVLGWPVLSCRFLVDEGSLTIYQANADGSRTAIAEAHVDAGGNYVDAAGKIYASTAGA